MNRFNKKYLNLLGKKCKPIIINSTISASFASSVLYGADNMHRSCHMDNDQVRKMVERAKNLIRKQNSEMVWEVSGIYSDETFRLTSDSGYIQDGVDRKSFRITN